ncbi:GNAT family N-acetyltransferase [Phenylobacterium kunshanense]|uniref:Ribosomal-protein-alanine acetyltransferase n=1 Tax=Phenylobacterium kunshanense TaxID=1445034 RepID=A0A328BRE8_9CAUL|nr:GNAT family N-acetyltransferase [Phenylobacterium kunshanense]RAK67648.1 ribosomal-protein-alanine acetyltransferase [Phenylobacterium kunshanense]
MNLAAATPDDAPAMASVHAQAFDTPWDESDFEGLLESQGIFGFLVSDEDPAGVLICRAVGGEAEILTVGVAPWARRRGVGLALMTAAIGAARVAGAGEMFLEVDVDNGGAVALYEGLGFVRTGLRKGYYDRGAAGRADALVMRLDLTSAAH